METPFHLGVVTIRCGWYIPVMAAMAFHLKAYVNSKILPLF